MSLVNLFRRFAGPLDQLQIPYMATGAVAAIVFGEPRLGLRADIYLAGDDPLDGWGLAHRRRETVGGEPVWIAPAEYVIVRKLEYYRDGGSEKHLTDIRAILRIRPDLVDRELLEGFIGERGLQAQWEKAR